MPEQLTKHPEVTLQVLRSAGAQCGEGAAQTILKKCPAERFCKLPGGEMCVYGLGEAPRMTQISASDWQLVQKALQLCSPQGAGPGPAQQSVFLGGGGLLVGAAVGAVLARRGRRRP